MKYLGWLSLLSVPVGVGLVLVSLSGKDTSGLAGIGVGAAIFVAALAAAIIGIIVGAFSFMSGTNNIPGTIGMIISLIIVGLAVWVFLSSAMDERAENKKAAIKEKAEKAAYDASPDIESNSITTLLESPHLKVKINDIAALPNDEILVYADIEGGRNGSKIVLFSKDGQLDPAVSFQNDEKIGFHRKRLLTAPNGDFLLVSTEMDGPDSFDRFGGRWAEQSPALLRNRHGKLIGESIENSGDVKVVRFARSGKLYGIEWISPVYRYVDTDKGEVKKEESKIEINLVEMQFNGKKFRRKAALEPALSKWMRNNDVERLSPEDLFFWPNGDIGLIVSSSGDSTVHRFDPTGKRALLSFKTGSESYSEPNHYIGFFPDGSLILEDKHNRKRIAQYRNGKNVTSFSKIVEKLRERIDIQASGVTSNGELIIAGNPHDKKNVIQFIFIDSIGKERKGFLLGKES